MNYDTQSHNGMGYHTDIFKEIKDEKVYVDKNLQEFRNSLPYSQTLCTDNNLNDVLDNFESYNRIAIKSWDLINRQGIDGTIIRFEQYKRQQRISRSPDFRLNLHKFNKGKYLASNMDRVKEDVMASLALQQLNDVEIYAGGTDSKSIQLVLFKLNLLIGGWLSLGDQIFIPLTNNWVEKINGQYPYLEIEQQLGPVYDITQAIQKQRSL